MGLRGTSITTRFREYPLFMSGEPVLDTHEGTLNILFEDGTVRVFNWDHVIDFYYLTEAETAMVLEEED